MRTLSLCPVLIKMLLSETSHGGEISGSDDDEFADDSFLRYGVWNLVELDQRCNELCIMNLTMALYSRNM
jgi:hypothetical protein